jgi:hypothetical protein
MIHANPEMAAICRKLRKEARFYGGTSRWFFLLTRSARRASML